MKHKQKNKRVASQLVIKSVSGVAQSADGVIMVRCPRCLEWKPLSGFGLRYMEDSDTLRNQSHCIMCRSEPSAEHEQVQS